MRRVGVGPRRLTRTRKASRREMRSVDRPYSPRACGRSQSRQIEQSRVKPPSTRGSAWRVASSIPRTSRTEVKVIWSCFIPKLSPAKCAPETKQVQTSDSSLSFLRRSRSVPTKTKMQALQTSFRRLYSSLPDAAASARTASTPRAVRLRRLRKRPELAAADSDATAAGSTPSEFARYQRSLAKGELVTPDGKELSEAEWLAKLNDRRTRIRGAKVIKKEDGTTKTHVVGQKIYLPNVLFRMVRNSTQPGKPYNPYEATFRVSQSVTKTDIRSYLSAVYGVQTTYIRTDNYLSPYQRTHTGWAKKRKDHKRAVVGLVEPFYYPQAIEDMSRVEREKREKWLEDSFFIKNIREMRVWELLRMTKKGSKNWHWKKAEDGHFTAQRGKIIAAVAAQRAKREQLLLETKERMTQFRATGEAIV
jgi:large subunit ribosomal protein L23